MTASSNNGDELYGHREIRQIFDSSGNKVGGNILPTKITGVPTNSEVGTHNVTLRVADTNGVTTDQSFTITVNNTNDAPTLTNAISDQTIAEDSSYSYQVPSNTFSDIDNGDSLTYTATLSNGSSLPSWLSGNASNRTL